MPTVAASKPPRNRKPAPDLDTPIPVKLSAKENLEIVQSTAAGARTCILHRLSPEVDALAHEPSDKDGSYTEEAIAPERINTRTAILELLTALDTIEREVMLGLAHPPVGAKAALEEEAAWLGLSCRDRDLEEDLRSLADVLAGMAQDGAHGSGFLADDLVKAIGLVHAARMHLDGSFAREATS